MAIINDPADPLKAEVRIRGTAPHQVLDFYIPKGSKGDKGDQGAPNVLTVLGTTTGPETAGATGPQGIQGLKGDPGGIVTSAITSGQDLNNFTTTGLWTCGDGNFATLPLNYPLASKAGQLLVVRAHSQLIHQTYYVTDNPHLGKVQYQRAYFSGTWYPWRAINSTRVDQTAGRAIYQWDDLNAREQLIYGDTGWRDVPVTDPAFSGNIRLRRVGSTVHLAANALTVGASGSTATNLIISPWPVGFVPYADMLIFQGRNNTNGVIGTLRVTPTQMMSYTAQTANTTLSFYTNWVTNDTWPTTLPGTAVGTIPNA